MVLSEVEVIGSIAYRNEFPATMALMKDDRANIPSQRKPRQ
jgi:hypothetical protein